MNLGGDFVILSFDLLVILIVCFLLFSPTFLSLLPFLPYFSFLCMPPGSADEISGDGNIYFHICVNCCEIIMWCMYNNLIYE